jgi:hypothetical protein
LLHRSEALTLKKLNLNVTHTAGMRFVRIIKGRNHLKKIKELDAVSPVDCINAGRFAAVSCVLNSASIA